MKKLIGLLCVTGTLELNAQLIINEVASSNYLTIDDEDGEYPDWVEIYNAGATPVNLAGYALTDNGSWNQWQFGDSVLPAGGRTIAFSSGKNRNYYNEPASVVDHWETAVFDNDIWEYKNGLTEPPADWNDVTFTGTWSTGEGGFGNGDGDDNTIIPSGGSFYYRKEFEIEDKSKIARTIVSMDWDDAYVVWINNVEVARINLTGPVNHSSYANYWHEALMYLGLNPKAIELDSALMQSLLVDGTNVIAVQIHQYDGGDATGRTWLHFGISTEDEYFSTPPDWFNHPGTATQFHTNFKISIGETIYLHDPSGNVLDSVLIDDLQVNHVRARIPDAGSWCYSDTPTPAMSNSGICYTGYAADPVILTTPGFYDGTINVEISGGEVYYTLDGEKPDLSSDLYTGPVEFNSTGAIRAIANESGKLPSRVVAGTYFIDEPTVLPVVSVIANPCDLFDEGPDCVAAYDNAEGWFNHNPKVSVMVEYYDTSHVRRFSDNYKMECVGNFSISLPQKSMRFLEDEDYGTTSEITYNIFHHDKPEINLIHGFRVRNMDQDYSGTRIKDIMINRVGMPTRCISTAYQNCVVFINGEYWGLYGAREEMDEYFLRDNFGVNPDEVDLMKTGWGGEEKTIPEAGSDTAYYNLIDFITTNDMSVDANYQIALKEVDVENWVDYFATNIFTDNEEWLYILENNFRLFRSYSPNIKWRYMLWDCTNSQFSANANTLSLSLNNTWNSVYSDMFNELLENIEFQNYFINRFADLMNYYWTEEFTEGLIDELKAEIEDEIPAQHARWGTGSTGTWNSNVNTLYSFYDNRIFNQRNQLENYFGLNDQVNITINVNPPGAGYVKISTIVPENLPWTGVYFDGVPVTVTAIPNPGFEFVNWDDHVFIPDPESISFTNNFSSNASFTANFTGSLTPNPIVITEMNYNSDTSRNAGDWVELYNNSDVAVNISDYILSDDYFYNQFKAPSNTVIPPHGYMVLAENVEDFLAQHPDVTNVVGDYYFSLRNDSDLITLKDLMGNVISTFTYYDDRPWPFTADGYGRTMELGELENEPSLPDSWFEGCVGGSPGEAFSLCLENPLVDEINYKSSPLQDAGDWFEIYNMGISDFDISNWIIKDKNGNDFIVPSGTTVEAGGYRVFYSDAAKFSEQFPTVTNKTGPLSFGFDGEGDVVLLYDNNGILFQSVGFDDDAPYPTSPDGGGTALQILDPGMNLNDPSNWTESCPEGSPGAEYLLPCANSIADLVAPGELLIYPNPANASVIIATPEAINPGAVISIIDITGVRILQLSGVSAHQIQLDISSLSPGVYTVVIREGGDIKTSTFVKG